MHPTDLPLAPPRILAVALISPLEREGRQPGFAADGPEFVGRRQLVRGVEAADIHGDFVFRGSEEGRAAIRAEMPPGIGARFALDRHGVRGEYGGGVKKRAVILAAVETVAETDPVGASRRFNPDGAAEAPSGEPVHDASPLKSMRGGMVAMKGARCKRALSGRGRFALPW